jgi:hypothetical protein
MRYLEMMADGKHQTILALDMNYQTLWEITARR